MPRQSPWQIILIFYCCSVRDSLWPMDSSTPGFPVLYCLLEFSQTHDHWLDDAIQPSHPLLSPSPPALSLAQHQGLFNKLTLHIRWPKYCSFVLTSASNLPMNIQGWFSLGLTDLISLLPNELSRVFSSTTVWKDQFFSTQPSLWSNSDIHKWLLEKP